jgi:hypothetical protein
MTGSFNNTLVASAAALHRVFPIGTIVQDDAIIAWVRGHADGFIAPDLLIDNPRLQLFALRWHLNVGAANLAEGKRFRLAPVEGEREVFVVCALAKRGAR